VNETSRLVLKHPDTDCSICTISHLTVAVIQQVTADRLQA